MYLQFTPYLIKTNLVTGIIYILLISIFIWLIVALYLLKKSFKVEKLSLGGVNVLFNESGTLYRKSIKNHLDSKELSLS
jgi:hypothetical protein